MLSDLDSLYYIDWWSITDQKLTLRFKPEYYSAEFVDPIITVHITQALKLPELQLALAGVSEEALIEIEYRPGMLKLWTVYDDIALSIEGSKVEVIRSPYSCEDLTQVISSKQQELDLEYASASKSHEKLGDIEHFVTELLDRAQTKKTLSSRKPFAADAQIDVLKRVLTRIHDK